MQTFGNEGDSAVPSEVFYFIFSVFIFWNMLDSQGYCWLTILAPGQTLMNPDITSLLQIKLLRFLSHQEDTKI
ncbi:hypothetical protein RHSIM_Rhsim08G0069800 [Rhododendron simsii]|uniref:Uncharacterized protein n=1 Tax=Rhododendron simsii TaxID=118357 RepID=A0A834LG17_RHOSS|nr:hypothetical protein RHSIM_Rhsim08G0069800 [Rhododendron simsii]